MGRSPTTVLTTDGEVQTNEEATVYVKELDLVLTVKLLEDAPAVSSLGKLCEDHGCSFEWTNGHTPHIINKGVRIQCNTENCVPIVVPGLSTTASPSSSSTPTPPTSSTQDVEGSIPDPASIGGESEDRLAREDPWHRPGEIQIFDENRDHEPAQEKSVAFRHTRIVARM